MFTFSTDVSSVLVWLVWIAVFSDFFSRHPRGIECTDDGTHTGSCNNARLDAQVIKSFQDRNMRQSPNSSSQSQTYFHIFNSLIGTEILKYNTLNTDGLFNDYRL